MKAKWMNGVNGFVIIFTQGSEIAVHISCTFFFLLLNAEIWVFLVLIWLKK